MVLRVSSLQSLLIGIGIVYTFVTTYRQIFFNCHHHYVDVDVSSSYYVGDDGSNIANFFSKKNFIANNNNNNNTRRKQGPVSLAQRNWTTTNITNEKNQQEKKNKDNNDNSKKNQLKKKESRRIGDGDNNNSYNNNNGEDSTTSAACLLVLDENHRLPEWLAYHYLALNLRYVVVAVDPHSTTSPTHIFAKWRSLTKIQIIEWTDTDFKPDGDVNYDISKAKTPRDKEQTHRHRQRDFYRACIRHLVVQQQQQQQQQQFHHQHNNNNNRNTTSKWTLFHDVDEYLTINRDVLLDNNDNSISIRQPGSVLKLIQKYSNTESSSSSSSGISKSWYDHFQISPCVTLGRILYSAKEDDKSKSSLLSSMPTLPSYIDPHRFDTLRYVYRANVDDKKHNGRSKSIIDLSRIDITKHLNKGWTNPHQPLTSVCKDEWTMYKQYPVGLHHYLGSWESYSYRKDARDTKSHGRQVWEERSMLDGNDGNDNSHIIKNEIRPWIQGFIDLVGESDAKYLLDGAGIIN